MSSLASIASDLALNLVSLLIVVAWIQYQKRRKLTPRQYHRKVMLEWDEAHGRQPIYTLKESLGLLVVAFVIGISIMVLITSAIRLLLFLFSLQPSAFSLAP